MWIFFAFVWPFAARTSTSKPSMPSSAVSSKTDRSAPPKAISTRSIIIAT